MTKPQTIVGGVPNPGFYKVRLVRGGIFVPVRIWYGPPLAEDALRFIDRSYRWQAVVAGKRAPGLGRVWPYCERWPISRDEYRYMLQVMRWGEKYSPTEPAANPHQAINLLTTELPF